MEKQTTGPTESARRPDRRRMRAVRRRHTGDKHPLVGGRPHPDPDRACRRSAANPEATTSNPTCASSSWLATRPIASHFGGPQAPSRRRPPTPIANERAPRGPLARTQYRRARAPRSTSSCPTTTNSYPEPTRSCPGPTSSCPEPTSSCPGPTSSCPEPTSSCPGPTSSCLEPTNSCPTMTSSCLGPTSSCFGPTSSCLGPTSSCLGPTSSCLGPTSSCPGADELVPRGRRLADHAKLANV